MRIAKLSEALKELNEQMQKREVFVENGQIVIDVIYPYCIDLDRCNTPEKILNWIRQLSEKTWMNTERLNQFIQIAFSQIGIEMAETS